MQHVILVYLVLSFAIDLSLDSYSNRRLILCFFFFFSFAESIKQNEILRGK